MRRSIRKQIGFTFIGFIALLLFAIGICNYFFLEEYYLNKKVNTLQEGMELLNRTDETQLQFQELGNFCYTNNLSVVVTDNEVKKVYTNMEETASQTLISRLFGYLTEVDHTSPQIIMEEDKYRVQLSKDPYTELEVMEIWGLLSDGRCFLIRTSVESIRDSVNLSNTFYIYIGGVFAIIAVIFGWLFSRRIAMPLTELAQISRRMADLDFDAKYESGGEDEIGVLGHNFNEMAETLEQTFSELKSANNELQKDIEKKTQIDEMRKEFLSNVSHELKTPIALIQGYAEGLQDNVNEDAESRAFYCEVIVDEAAKMNTMVKKLLSLNQLEFGNDQIEMERFDITALIQGVINSAHILTENKGIEVLFNQEMPIYVWGDEFKIEEILTNFISNALNHLKYDNRIEIRCQEKDGIIRTSVFNSGDPIPEADIDKIWIKFYKVDKARTREYGGSGIGLSIVKAIVESMNQQCGVQNYENGVEFWFTLENKNI